MITLFLFCMALLSGPAISNSSEYPQVSGIYPHLAMFNSHGECGTGAVVPWAGRLWVITYAPHQPFGSTDKLYEITPELKQIVRPESIGGTPANRMIHEESQQLFLASYAIDHKRNVRVIPFKKMPGRMTGTARHLTDPQQKVYMATMEEGFYEIDTASLDVTTLYADSHVLGKQSATAPGAKLPGYHGKGLYSGQGVLVYANNGEKSREAQRRPFIPSGVLASWDGSDWEVVRRNQFTEVTGPGGIYGNPNPETDPIWTLSWDHKSVLLMSGVEGDAKGDHIIRSDDGNAAMWAGVIDDLWKLGKPRGVGGPWFDTAVKATEPSDPYLMTGYDQKSFELSHDSDQEVVFAIQVDITGNGSWRDWKAFAVPPGNTIDDEFPKGFHAYWLRVIPSHHCVATAQFTYE